jgi:hypothetical protein
MGIFEIVPQQGERVLVAIEIVAVKDPKPEKENQETAMKVFRKAFPNTPIKSCHFVQTI